MKRDPRAPQIVIFHSMDGQSHCDDGLAAAWVFRRRFGPTTAFWPGIYGAPAAPMLWDIKSAQTAFVAMVDFSWKRGDMKALALAAGNLLVLDHHRTAEAELGGLVDELLAENPGWAHDGFGQFLGLPDIRFDMERSGARLAWDYCFPGEEPPDLLLRIEDNDLWRTPRRYPDSLVVQAALRAHPQDFEIWDDLMARPIAELAADGRAIRGFLDAKIAELKRTAWQAEIAGVQMPICNAPWFLASDLAGALAEDDPEGRAAVYFDQAGRRIFSLRARKGADVSGIAKKLGGGGHPGAAGFQVPRP